MDARIVVWNLHGFRAGIESIADVLTTLAPDAALLSECGVRRDLEHLVDRLGFQAIHGSLPFRFLPSARNAVVARKDWKVIGVAGGGFTKGEGGQPRGAVVASFSLPNESRCTLVATHLGLHAGERAKHAEELLQMVQGTPFPAFVGGDWNDKPDGRAYRTMIDAGLRNTGGEGPTFPAANPESRIDYLFVPGDSRVIVRRASVHVDAATASDHLPLVVDLSW